MSRLAAFDPTRLEADSVWARVGQHHIAVCLGDGPQLGWSTLGEWRLHDLDRDGTVVANCWNDLAILQLHHGNRRMTFDEAEALVSSQPSTPGEDA